MGCLLSGRRPCDPHTTRCVVSVVQSSLQSRMQKYLWRKDLYGKSSPVGTRGVSRRYAPRSPVGTHPVLQEGGQHACRTPLDARTMTAVHAGACRDVRTRARAGANGRRGQVWCSRRLTRGGVHQRRPVEQCVGEEGHVTCGWRTDRSTGAQDVYEWERWRRGAPTRRRRQWCRGRRAAGPPGAGGGWRGKALQNDGKYDSIQSPIVWWTHVYPRGWRAARADLWGKRTRARPQTP